MLGSPEQGSGLRELQRGIFGAYKGGIICCTPSSWPPTSLYSVCGSDCITAVANDDSFPSSPPTTLFPPDPPCLQHGAVWDGSCHGSSHRRRKTSALPLGNPGDAGDAHASGAVNCLEICCHLFFWARQRPVGCIDAPTAAGTPAAVEPFVISRRHGNFLQDPNRRSFQWSVCSITMGKQGGCGWRCWTDHISL